MTPVFPWCYSEGMEIGEIITEVFTIIGGIVNWIIGATNSTQGFLVSLGVSPGISWSIVVAIWLVVLYPLWKVFLPLASIGGGRKIVSPEKRDPQRVFTSQQKNAIYSSVGNRCEHRFGPFGIMRCRVRGAKNLNGDHWFPHARGGASTTKNCVALCEKHNQKKSAKVPTKAQTLTLSMYRRMYMKKYIVPGQWM